MESTGYCGVIEYKQIEEGLYNKLNKLGLIPNDVRKGNIGKSDYSKHLIQPWSIWIDYNLNPWDADIIKRTLRTKEESGMSEIDARIMDYEKIKHICDERIRQLKFDSNVSLIQDCISSTDISSNHIGVCSFKPKDVFVDTTTQTNNPHTSITYSLKGSEINAYNDFCNLHKSCKGIISTIFSYESGIGTTVKVKCSKCGDEHDITDISNW